MKGEGNEKKEKRPARVVSETEEGANIKVFMSESTQKGIRGGSGIKKLNYH